MFIKDTKLKKKCNNNNIKKRIWTKETWLKKKIIRREFKFVMYKRNFVTYNALQIRKKI